MEKTELYKEIENIVNKKTNDEIKEFVDSIKTQDGKKRFEYLNPEKDKNLSSQEILDFLDKKLTKAELIEYIGNSYINFTDYSDFTFVYIDRERKYIDIANIDSEYYLREFLCNKKFELINLLYSKAQGKLEAELNKLIE